MYVDFKTSTDSEEYTAESLLQHAENSFKDASQLAGAAVPPANEAGGAPSIAAGEVEEMARLRRVAVALKATCVMAIRKGIPKDITWETKLHAAFPVPKIR